jgi:hypothetical protein
MIGPEGRRWAALAAAALCVFFWPSPASGTRPLRSALRALSYGYAGGEIPLTRAEREALAGAEAVKRLYRTSHGRFSLIAIDPSRNRHAVHDPSYCFTGSGWTATDESRVELPGGYGMSYSYERKGRSKRMLYWFSDGSSRHASAPRFWLQSGLRSASLGKSGSAPIFLMLQSHDEEETPWPRVLEELRFLKRI